MSTQVLEVEASSLPSRLRVRDDVTAVLVLVIADGRPVKLLRAGRPENGILELEALSEACPGSADRRDGGRLFGHGLNIGRRTATRVSVVIPTRERPDDLERCLRSLSVVRAAGHEVIVVDNAPATDRTAQVAERFGCRYLVEPEAGANYARNAGVAIASHDLVAFVDDDVVVSPAWLSAITKAFANPSVGCATGLVLPLELETAAQEAFETYCEHRRDLRPHVYSRRVLAASAAGIVGMGANMAFRRDVLMTLGGFDVRFGPGTRTRTGDETDMFARTLDAGWSIVYSPNAYVWHRHRRTSREVRSCVFGYGVGLYGVLTKRLIEQRDLRSLITGGRWLLGPIVKAARAKIAHAPSAPWSVVLAETAGAVLGPLSFVRETWRRRGATPHLAG